MSALPMPEHLDAETARVMAVAQAGPRQPARGATKTVRFAKGSDLLVWYEHYASANDLSANGAIILALMTFRAAVERRGEAGKETTQ